MARTTPWKRWGSTSGSRASAFARSKPRPCVSCGTLRAAAPCGITWDNNLEKGALGHAAHGPTPPNFAKRTPMQLAILGVFAHPDDEGSASGSLARYAAQGVRAYVACATRGDGVDAKISEPGLATRETLGQVRSQELACACEK